MLHRKISKGVLSGAFFLAAFVCASAQAGEEKKCAKQYSLEEHLILEWAALGGDPHAQFAITQCAFPKGTKKLSDEEKIYAWKWLTLASCETLETKAALERNVRTRRLKEKGDLSFRRFGGHADGEKLSTREKMFWEYRTRRVSELKTRYETLNGTIDAPLRAKAQDALVEEFSNMGALGLLRLSQLADCPHVSFSRAQKAAAWSAAEEKWDASALAVIAGKSENRGWSLAKESKARHGALNTLEKRTAEFEKDRLIAADAQRVAHLEDRAALADLQNLSTAFVHASEGDTPTKTVTLAVQYALEALDMIEFVNGPDNDYGPTTIEAAQRLQASWGQEETRWLNHEQIRNTVCKAATEAADPISMYHVALMHANGWGFKRDYSKARSAISQAEKAIKVRLDAIDELPEWKQVHYPQYVAEIEAEKILIDAAWEALPEREKSQPEARDVCRTASIIQ